MDGRRFDDLVRDAARPVASRRNLALGLVAGAAALLLGSDVAEAGKQRRRRRRNRRRGVTVCFRDVVLTVDRVAARELISRGAQLGACRPPLGSDETCENATLPCNTNLTFCGEDCFCFLTTIGESFCAANGIECLPGQTCITDDDCSDRFGDGSRCVPTLGCDLPGCTETGNACAQPCNA
jgi:hypothetical protein